MLPPPLRPTLFPYTTLFRSHRDPRLSLLVAPDRGRGDRGRRSGRAGGGQVKAQAAHATTPRVALAGNPNTGKTSLFKDRKSTRLNSSHLVISYAVFCLKQKN